MYKRFCLDCKTDNCSCTDNENSFLFNDNLRPPRLVSAGKINKSKWKNFLKSNPRFAYFVDPQVKWSYYWFLIEVGVLKERDWDTTKFGFNVRN